MSTGDVAAAVRDAAASGTALRVRGNGCWLQGGRPVRAGGTLSIASERGIVEYVPGDLTLTARAGTPLSELREATRANDQWLPLDPWGGDTGTLGATISTATAGPHSYAMGLPRDVVLGLEFVTGTGDAVRAGGRVVKNVAGFDLTRLLVGSWGTLGVITEVTVRLRARPAELHTVALSVSGDARQLNALAVKLRALPFTPVACELVNAALARHLGLPGGTTLLIRVGGNTNSVRGQLDALRDLGTMADAPSDVWSRLRTAEAGVPGAGVWRWSALPSAFGDTWSAAEAASRGFDSMTSGSPLRGVVRVAARGEAGALVRAAGSFSGTSVMECLPPDAWPLVPAPRAVSLEAAIRSKFDPRGILNPGIMGGSE